MSRDLALLTAGIGVSTAGDAAASGVPGVPGVDLSGRWTLRPESMITAKYMITDGAAVRAAGHCRTRLVETVQGKLLPHNGACNAVVGQQD